MSRAMTALEVRLREWLLAQPEVLSAEWDGEELIANLQSHDLIVYLESNEEAVSQ